MWIVLVLVCFLAADPATAPSTETLLSLKFEPPVGWNFEGKTGDGKTAVYTLGNRRAVMAMNIAPQEFELDASAARNITQQICAKSRESAKKNGDVFIDPPVAVQDERFFARVHCRYRHKDDKTGQERVADQTQIFRVIGDNLIHVAVTAWTDDLAESRAVFEEAERMLLSVRGGGSEAIPESQQKPKDRLVRTTPKLAAKPVTLERAKIRVAGPAGWKSESNDNASGIVITFRDPQDPTNLIAVSVRPLPAEARSDPKLRDALVDEIVSSEKQQFKIDGAKLVGATQAVKDNRFLRKTRTKYEAKRVKFQISSRALRIGDNVVSITALALDDVAEVVEKLADDVAAGVKR